MADIYVNFPSSSADFIRGDIEFYLEDMLGSKGRISGGGAVVGGPGFNIDIEYFSDDGVEVRAFIESLATYLRSIHTPQGTNLVVIIGEEKPEQFSVN